MTRRKKRQKTRTLRRAFTLIEASLATVIVGVGVLAIVEAQQAFLQKNAWSTHTSTAMFLANEIREMTRNMPRHDAFSGGVYFLDPTAHTGFRGWGPEPDEVSALDFDDLDDFDGVAFGTAPNLPGALNIPHAEATDRRGELDRSRVTVFFCNGPQCPQSPTAIRALLDDGFPADRIIYYRGGMHDWVTLGLPTVPGE